MSLRKLRPKKKYRMMPIYGSSIITITQERVLTGSLLLEISIMEEYTAIAMFSRYRSEVNTGQSLVNVMSYFLPI